MKKLLCLLALVGVLTLGLSALALADAPGTAKVSKRGINYPAYLYPKGQRGAKDYQKLIRPYKPYDFRVVPLAARHYVPAPW